MNVSRKFTHRTITAVAVLASAAGLVACGGQRDPSAEQQVRPGLNRMEHEAHRLPQGGPGESRHGSSTSVSTLRTATPTGGRRPMSSVGSTWAARVPRSERRSRSPTACAAAAEALEALLRLTRQEDGRVYRMDGTYSAGSALTQELCE